MDPVISAGFVTSTSIVIRQAGERKRKPGPKPSSPKSQGQACPGRARSSNSPIPAGTRLFATGWQWLQVALDAASFCLQALIPPSCGTLL